MNRHFPAAMRPVGQGIGDASGQALLETVFAIGLLFCLLIVMAQLFLVSEKAIFVMTQVQKSARMEVRDADRKDTFGRREVDDPCGSVAFLPGMEWLAGHYPHGCRETDPPAIPVARRLYVYGGSLQNGANLFYANHGGNPYYDPIGRTRGRTRLTQVSSGLH